ncbi:MAG: SLC13 family permease [Candidatus Dormibacteraeota bacterium]|nr:SLC13 family permease [Candidatus Dormibacteraeota bacterium]
MGWQAWYTLAVVLILVLVLATDRLSAPVAVMGAVVALVAPGVITTAQALAGFSNEAPVTIAALYVLAGAVHATGALDGITARLLSSQPSRSGRPERGELARLLVPVAGMSAFIYNTPLTAMSAPPVATWASRTGRRPSWYLLPLNLAILVGGMITAIGTTTNVVISGLLTASHHHPLYLFEPVPVGLAIAVAVLGVVILTGPWLSRDRTAPSEGFFDPRAFTVEMSVVPGGGLAGKSVAEAGLRHLDGVYLVEVNHQGATTAAVGPEHRLAEGDRLVFTGNINRILDLHRIAGLAPIGDPTFAVTSGPRRQFYEAVVAGDSELAGKTLKEVGFRSRFDGAVVAIHRAGESLQGKLGEMPLRAGDVLLVLAARDFRRRAGESKVFALVASPDGAPGPVRRQKSLVVNLILAGFLVAVISGFTSVLVASLIAAGLVVVFGVMKPWEARGAIDLTVLVVLCGSFAIGVAVGTSGLATECAKLLIGALHQFGPAGIVAGVLLATVIITQLVTNNAAAILMFPIATATAAQAHLNFRSFVIAILIGASASFITPIGYQTNMIVQGLGGYRWSDFVRIGLLPLIVCVAVGLVALLWAFPPAHL